MYPGRTPCSLTIVAVELGRLCGLQTLDEGGRMSLATFVRSGFQRLQAAPKCATCGRRRDPEVRFVSGRRAYACEACILAAVRAPGLTPAAGDCVFYGEPKAHLVAMGEGHKALAGLASQGPPWFSRNHHEREHRRARTVICPAHQRLSKRKTHRRPHKDKLGGTNRLNSHAHYRCGLSAAKRYRHP